MNWPRLVCVGWLVPLAGCTLAQTATRNAIHEPKQACHDYSFVKHLRADARYALREVCGKYPKKTLGEEFRDGFEDGYADYLDSGGPCIPPPMPPLKYRTVKYLTPEGHCRIRDYFLGFKYGVDVAVATGRRPYMTVPVLVADKPPPPPLNITVIPAPPVGLSTDVPGVSIPIAPAAPTAPAPAPAPKVPAPADSNPLPPTPVPNVPLPVPLPLPTPVEPPKKPPESGTSTGTGTIKTGTVKSDAPPATVPPTAVIPGPVPIPVMIDPTPPPAPVVAPPTHSPPTAGRKSP